MDVATKDFASMNGVETVALSQEMLEWRLFADGAERAIGPAELRILPLVVADRFVADNPFSLGRFHFREEIREMVKGTGTPHGGVARGIEAEEIDPGFAVMGDIRSDIQLRKTRQARNRRQEVCTNPAHAKGDHSNPALSFESVERQFMGNQWPQLIERDRPVCEKEIVPGLLHEPRARGQGPWTMLGVAEERVHTNSLDSVVTSPIPAPCVIQELVSQACEELPGVQEDRSLAL